jgi:hypothetical protein
VGAAERYWKLEGRATGAGKFLGTEDVGRALLGEVLRNVKDWMIRDWIRTITPTLLPTAVSKMQWGQASEGACGMPGCSGELQTLSHLLLHCRNAEIAGVRVKTHDRIVQSLHMVLMGLKGIESSWGPATDQQAWQELPLPPEITQGIPNPKKEYLA